MGGGIFSNPSANAKQNPIWALPGIDERIHPEIA
jgi:hypothetical protein